MYMPLISYFMYEGQAQSGIYSWHLYDNIYKARKILRMTQQCLLPYGGGGGQLRERVGVICLWRVFVWTRCWFNIESAWYRDIWISLISNWTHGFSFLNNLIRRSHFKHLCYQGVQNIMLGRAEYRGLPWLFTSSHKQQRYLPSRTVLFKC